LPKNKQKTSAAYFQSNHAERVDVNGGRTLTFGGTTAPRGAHGQELGRATATRVVAAAAAAAAGAGEGAHLF